ncbi:MAG: nitrous oxide-stimulated promoter family protein [Anaerolineae bacterium]|nr:nitrous oxide-stimulated promoter family protein [Anaerolineae bacterium]
MNPGRLERERRTLFAMIEIYCRAHHGTRSALCAECEELYQYGLRRLDKCPFQDDKPTCAKCPIHCYNPAMRERVRQVMRFAGPRMLLHHPLLTIRHYLDELLYRKAGRPGGSPKGKKRG